MEARPDLRRWPDPNLAAFYGLVAVWFAAKSVVLVTRTIHRPSALVVPADWTAGIIESLPFVPWVVTVAVAALVAAVGAGRIAFGGPAGTPVRVGLFVVALAVNGLDHLEGAISHWNHLLLLGLLLGIVIDVAEATPTEVRLFQFGLATTYGLAGVWKLRHILDAVRAGSVDGTWLSPDALMATVRRNQFVLDRDVVGLRLLDWAEPATPVLFVTTTVLLLAMPLLVWSTKGRVVAAFVVLTFHWVNWWLLGASFGFIGVLGFATFMPWAEVAAGWRSFRGRESVGDEVPRSRSEDDGTFGEVSDPRSAGHGEPSASGS